MKTMFLGAALAAAALSAAACSSTPTPTAGEVAVAAYQNQAPVRAAAERGFSVYVDGIEAAAPTSAKDKATQASHIATAYSVLKVGRAGFAASGLPGSPELTAAVTQADADYARVMAELQSD